MPQLLLTNQDDPSKNAYKMAGNGHALDVGSRINKDITDMWRLYPNDLPARNDVHGPLTFIDGTLFMGARETQIINS